MDKKTGGRGFTLIELLVVMAIIAILSSVVLFAVSKARARGRDAKRNSDMKQIEVALSYFYDSAGANGIKSYPSTGGAWYSSESGDNVSNNGGDWVPGLAPNYIDALPRNPGGGEINDNVNCGSGVKSSYRYKSDGHSYKLLAYCSPEATWNSSYTFYDPVRPTWAWMVCAGSTACTTW